MGVASVLQPEIWCLNMHGVQEFTTYSTVHGAHSFFNTYQLQDSVHVLTLQLEKPGKHVHLHCPFQQQLQMNTHCL